MAPPTGGMTFGDIRNECINYRFGPNLSVSIDRWINLRYGTVWADSDWPFKGVRREAVTGTSTITPPTGFHKASVLEDTNGEFLQYLQEDVFDACYPVNSTQTGAPQHYTVINGVIYLGPPASGTSTFYLSYDRRPWHYDTGGAIVQGLMSGTEDYPAWPPEWHYILVIGAMSTGLKTQNDPTWEALEQEFGMILTQMREDLLPPDTNQTRQYGRNVVDLYADLS